MAADAGVAETGFLLEGLRCAGCVRRTEQALRAAPGVREASINYGDHRALVRFDPAATSVPVLARCVEALGYHAIAYDPDALDRPRRTQARAALVRLLVAGFLAMNVMWIAIALYIGTYQGMDLDTRRALRWLAIALSLPSLLWCAQPFFRGAAAGLARRELSADLPVAIAIAVAFASNVAGTWFETRHLFVDSSAWIVFLLLLGRTLERSASLRAAGAVERLRNLAPAFALRQRSGAIERVPVAELAVGDEIRVAAGELVPVDGALLSGPAELDESALTGESLPVLRAAGEAISAGARALLREIALRVGAPASRGTLARLAALLERAQAERPRIQRSADRFAAVFAPAVLAIAALTALGWAWSGAPAQDVAFRATAVLIVACPCVFGLATPLAIAAALGRAASLGVLVKSGEALERLADVSAVLLDKTGTLTAGRFALSALLPAEGVEEKELLRAAAAAEGAAVHPLGDALRREAQAAGLALEADALERRALPGRGIVASGAGRRIAVGSLALLAEEGVALPAELTGQTALRAQRGETLVFVARDGRALGAIALCDELRSDARDFAARMRAEGIELELVSGDNAGAVAAAADQAGIERRRAGVSPEGKLEALRELRAGGRAVLAVGDGLNDAALLGAADVGAAIARGSEIAVAAADLVVRSPRLGAIADALALSRACRARIRENFAFALCYNLVAVPLAVAGLLEPLGAAIAMALSSLVVTGNSVRLLRWERAR